MRFTGYPMLKKLNEEKIREILETGIEEFASHGLDRANVNVIAKKSGVSVGVLYKYYTDKESLFFACLRHSLAALKEAVDETVSGKATLTERAERLIRAVQKYARVHPNYNVLYNEITAGASQKYARAFAEEIEGLTAEIYARFITEAKNEGDVRTDIDPRLFAFFFDNLLLALQFSYSCDYYRERFRIFCGEDILEDDERVVSELLKFMESAFAFSRAEIRRGG